MKSEARHPGQYNGCPYIFQPDMGSALGKLPQISRVRPQRKIHLNPVCNEIRWLNETDDDNADERRNLWDSFGSIQLRLWIYFFSFLLTRVGWEFRKTLQCELVN